MQSELTSESHKVEIREFYNDYVAPLFVTGVVRKLLDTVPAEYLSGIDCVVLTNQSGLSRKERLGKFSSRKRRVLKSRALGLYHPAWHGSPPWIELYVDNIVPQLGKAKWLPIAREGCFGYVLFHEIGHHIHAATHPEFREKEDVADEWRKKLWVHFGRKNYWFLRPVGRPIAWLYKVLVKKSESPK